jgi:hypothetical protein
MAKFIVAGKIGAVKSGPANFALPGAVIDGGSVTSSRRFA